jgi:hypothetical protein
MLWDSEYLVFEVGHNFQALCIIIRSFSTANANFSLWTLFYATSLYLTLQKPVLLTASSVLRITILPFMSAEQPIKPV